MLDRRAFLLSGLAVYGASARELFAAAPALQNAKFPTSPFTLGICSGDPGPDGMVLWTRLAIDPLNGGGMPPQPVEVHWQIAADDRMSKVVKSGRAIASPEWGHSVHVEVSGLQPHRWYWYQFRAGNELSPIGRTRTFPAEGVDVDRLRFAIASCQHYETGLYTAYQHMAEEDLDLVMHLGDYIYESPGRDNFVRKHVGGELMTVADYRNRYAQYRSDPALRAVHASFPFLVVWDDHEVDNNYAGLHQEAGAPVEQFALRRAAGYKAYYEHMPLRRSSIPEGRAAAVVSAVQLWRAREHLDARHAAVPNRSALRRQRAACVRRGTRPARDAARRGAGEMAAGTSRSVADRVEFPCPADPDCAPRSVSRTRAPLSRWTSGTDTSRAARACWRFLGSRKPSNPVALAGDVHNNWVNDLRLEPDDPKTPVVATEFVGTSISSAGDGSDMPATMKAMVSENECVRFANDQRGYVSFDLRPKELRADFRVVEYVSKPGAPDQDQSVICCRNPGNRGAKPA